MNESFETITDYIQYKLSVVENELKRSDNLQIRRSPFYIKVLITNLVVTVECCKALPIFNNLNHISKDEVLSSLCVIYDSFYRLADIYYMHIEQITSEGESAGAIYESINDIAFEILSYLHTKHEDYVKEWNKI